MAEDHQATEGGENANAAGGGSQEAESSKGATSPLLPPSAVSYNIWPPSQRARDAVIQNVIDSLSSPSALTKVYGVVPVDEAAAVALLVEQEAFGAANTDEPRAVASIDAGMEALQIYTKEISRRVMESVKSRAAAAVDVGVSVLSTVETESQSA